MNSASAHGLAALSLDESSGCTLHRPAVRFAQRLHYRQRGANSILFIFFFMIFYCGAAMVWNMGQTVSARIWTQTAADTSAYSAAVWTSRATNMMVGPNILMLRELSVLSLSLPLFGHMAEVIAKWAEKLADACAGLQAIVLCVPMAIAIGIEAITYFSGYFASTIDNFLEAIIPFGGPYDRLDELAAYQKAWHNAVPAVVEAQRQEMENYYGVKIRLSQPAWTDAAIDDPSPAPPDNGQSIRAPIKELSAIDEFLTLLFAVPVRILQDKDGVPEEHNFDSIVLGEANGAWDHQFLAWFILPVIYKAFLHDQNYALADHWLFFEFSPVPPGGLFGLTHDSSVLLLSTASGGERSTVLESSEPYTVIATAVLDDVTTKSAAKGRAAGGLYDQPVAFNDSILAYAQAETYQMMAQYWNGVVPFPLVPLPYPWRLWTTIGWNWQPRLNMGDQLETCLTDDPGLADLFRDEVRFTDKANAKKVALH